MVIGFPGLNTGAGRLGNQMYCIAATIGTALSNGITYGFPEWNYNRYFKKPLPIYTAGYKLKWIEKHFEYEKPIINPVFSTEIVADFYSMRSYKYWWEFKDTVFSHFEFSDELKRKIFLELTYKLTGTPAAIHVRRGDYLKLQKYHPVLTLDYYNAAIKQFDKHQRFVVYSDDIEWCKKHFLTDKFVFASGSPIEDLCSMSMCKAGVICANSSFSEWAALIGGVEKVIVPKMQFGEANAHLSTKDLYLPNWIQI